MSHLLTTPVECTTGILRCSNCGGELKSGTGSSLRCLDCHQDVAMVDGILHFVRQRGELSGVNYSQPDWQARERDRERQYEQNGVFSDAWLRSLPFPTQDVPSTFQHKNGALGKNFLSVLGKLGVSGSETVLDIAAGTCWTSRELADRGCTVFATDIRTIKYTGLRSAEAYFESGSAPFHRLCWEFGPIPIRDEAVDLVVCNNAFQYVECLGEILTEIRRVLRPHGKLALTWTGAQAPLKSKAWGPGHQLSTYHRQVRCAGFQDIDCWIPESLFSPSGLVRTRKLSNLQKVLAGTFDGAWVLLAPIRGWLMGRPMLTAAKLVGLPFNLICRRGSENP